MNEQQHFDVAVVGATGAVGQQMLKTLEQRDFPIKSLKLLSSKRSAGKQITFKGQSYTVEEATPESFQGVQLALFSAGGSVSKALVPEAIKRGAVCVDNTSAFRMDTDVPLVVPEVNESDLRNHQGVIANPNCSTIQMVVALEPIRKKLGLKKVIVSTYQAVSGAGLEAVEEMEKQTRAILDGKEATAEVLPVAKEKRHYQIAFNAIPQIDVFQDNGYTFEEMKMINETKKIMHMPELEVAATCVRLPIETGHSESIYFETEQSGASVKEIQALLSEAPGITLQDNPAEQLYPLVTNAVGKNDVFVGRVRRDLDRDNGYHAWVVSDNLLKGAAWNSVQIAESLIKLNLLNK
ncbi:aspartate-semialdehyde dehydrogenase [Shouchella clausii]|jgi:aspartate-semialdehyde dehydrogenase|uniref:Aspartate-semialdehyde dehydrogenase n=2 Tax=Shouchella TaxID=2893057 RepID=A0A268P2Z9_SHOCL|nr:MULTISPECIES: aspartate-semialdehyde dehydrogenase [Shouchella]MCM3312144.1 aspartate-semialdehyde dehydrogenase [Psychrobacillus sp. MER TA 17]ALA54890.1 Aspartate-semialdehyde dehydrogenase [Shouchella clausii]KKI87875.1 aspartate-semialdehyde dehydrogenase [Shouchella clausii]MBU3230871.1 aspartate-semialdehyde dehydrogenase [Shouchella clausii]MBU3263054.1 aspartate-semialdehyde dehydrogenase [Shouchella clausii]